jgi:hypothetical protein
MTLRDCARRWGRNPPAGEDNPARTFRLHLKVNHGRVLQTLATEGGMRDAGSHKRYGRGVLLTAYPRLCEHLRVKCAPTSPWVCRQSHVLPWRPLLLDQMAQIATTAIARVHLTTHFRPV